MACRTYDIILDCGCMYSADGGGGCVPCLFLPPETPEEYEQARKCEEAHKKWYASEEYKEYERECYERNN